MRNNLLLTLGLSCFLIFGCNKKQQAHFSASKPTDYSQKRAVVQPSPAASIAILEEEAKRSNDDATASSATELTEGNSQKAIATVEKISRLQRIKEAVAFKTAIKGIDKIEKKQNINKNQVGQNQVLALLLGIFFGVLGLHRFYLGYIGIGIIQLLTGGGCGIWWIIDVIRIAIGDLGPKNGSYN